MMMLVQAELRQDEDDTLIAAAAQGDRSAFGELYSRYARMVHAILLARVPPRDAEDLLQDVFMSAMRQLRVLRTAAAFKGWLAAIARNRAIDYFRDAKPQAELDAKVERSLGVAASQEAFEILELIQSLLQKLDVDSRTQAVIAASRIEDGQFEALFATGAEKA